MNPPSGHANAAYYHEDELAARHAHSRQYEQVQQHEFQARLPTTGLGPSADDPAASGNTGGMFYPPSTFASTRMAAQQYSAAPPATAFQPQTDYIDSDLPPTTPTVTTGSASASSYYPSANVQGQAQTQSQYAAPPMSSLQPTLHSHAHPHQEAVPTSASVPAHSSTSGHTHTSIGQSQLAGPPSPTNLAARRHTTSDIGKWKTFATGPFAGRTVRAEIIEVQKADLGRKCADPPTSGNGSHGGDDGENSAARKGKEKEHDKDRAEKEKDGETRAVRKDRRPLDPPPVVSLQLYESVHHGTPHQYERVIAAEDVEIGGLICHVDLYRVTIPPSPTEVASLTLHAGGPGHGQAFQQGSTHSATFGQYAPGPSPVSAHPSLQQSPYSPYEQRSFIYPPQRTARPSLLAAEEENQSNAASPLEAGWESASPISPMSPYAFHSHPNHAHAHSLSTTIRGINASIGAPIDPDALPPPSEADKLSRVLFGESYAHACSILDLSGRPTLYFVFADLSVKLEGLFRPRYRFFDLFSRTGDSADVPILAQCFGGAFAVYSTKEFPGLKASTPLTKHLSRWGIRVNIRETERKRRAPDGGGANSSNAGTATKDKKRGANTRRRGGSISGGASSGASVRGEDEGDERQGSGEVTSIPRGVDAPRRYLEGTVRGRGANARGKTSGSGPSSSAIADTSHGEGSGRSRK
ncbi:uncharacterized protein FOMMEDRAFT_141163 [Fomitiporia mediterranea MF3/22]|uniref:uncharacterized protein n=1 Tax=Fomitiporia mediterranea (strain MF3/22) TaxID=694068 RepID=UPI0004408996|nr:uncharacterized protein FOMMEDRAFT_141163 [Fomitiporia mediterranea MF3/22]EJD01948.1 hypothetical protein FOMMEDRAFT_141163 [Fomitiporia mediterranea MF3/22]